MCTDTRMHGCMRTRVPLPLLPFDFSLLGMQATPKDLKCLEELENLEEELEAWWKSKAGAKGPKDYGDLEQALCFESGQGQCCPPGHWGPRCAQCPDMIEGAGVCSGRGSCNGDGSRGGTGKCKCKKGFLAASACNVCKDGLTLVPGVGRAAKCVAKPKEEL